MIRLGVNIDHVATLRQARGTRYPDPVAAAALAEQAGADQIVVHLREDRRHIQDHDLRTLRKTIQTSLNLEMACVEQIIAMAEDMRPDCCTFVPEKRNELTTEGGLDVRKNSRALGKAAGRLRDKGIVVSLFIDADPSQIEAAKSLEAEVVELHTGPYCDAKSGSAAAQELEKLETAAKMASGLGLRVAAGHGLNYENTRTIVKAVPEIVEYNIGHGIISRAVFVGLEAAVREMKALLSYGRDG